MNKEKLTCHVKIGDTIKIITGEKKGLIGKIKAIFLKKAIVFIEGVGTRIKYLKKTNNSDEKKVEIETPIHISNVMLWDGKLKVASKIGYKTVEAKKYRYFKKSGNIIE
jgi:large subunit ribosomal protein L24